MQGKIASIKERQEGLIQDLKLRIDALTKTIVRLEKRGSYQALHHKKRRLALLMARLEKKQTDLDNGIVRICFGSKKLFRAQFNLEANGYKSFSEWKKNWRSSRDNRFFLLGSKDESGGNQSCTATLSAEGAINLRLRLPDALVGAHGKYLIISNLHFRYGHKEIVSAIVSCKERAAKCSQKDLTYKNLGQAISYRFKRDERGWRVFVSLSHPKICTITKKDLGVIGVDLNADHLAIAEIDRHGNPISRMTIPLVTYGKKTEQVKAMVGDAVKIIVEKALKAKKPIAIENLDFQKKKALLREMAHSKQSRMLSSLTYNKIKSGIKSRGYRQGVMVEEINPAYTSLIGRVKFAKRYGLSIHQAASVSIARRSQNVSERLPRSLEVIPNGTGGYVALSLPERNRGKHVWSDWRRVQKKLKVALAAQFRTTECRSSSHLRQER